MNTILYHYKILLGGNFFKMIIATERQRLCHKCHEHKNNPFFCKESGIFNFVQLNANYKAFLKHRHF